MRVYTLISFFVFLIVLLLHYTEPVIIKRLVLKVEDTRFILRNSLGLEPEFSDKVVIVAIDERSINEIGRWPWDRKVIGDLLKSLKEAKVISVDIVFSEPSDKESDEYLAKVIRENGNVILSFFFRSSDEGKENLYILDNAFFEYEIKSRPVKIPSMPSVEGNIPLLSLSSAGEGFINIESDEDGFYRKYPIAYTYKGYLFLPLALQTFRLFSNEEIRLILSRKGVEKFLISSYEIPVYEGRFLKINFYNPEDVNVISAVDILKGKFEEEFFRDKAVFVGVTETGIYDVRPTPVEPFLPGVFIHAFVFSNLVERHFIKTNSLFEVLYLFILFMLINLIFLIKTFSKRLLLYFLLIILSALINFSLFSFLSIDINFSYGFLLILLTGLSVESFRVITEERKVKKLKEAFSSYVSPEILNIIIKNPEKLKLGGERKEITVLFMDIRNFTELSEKKNPEELVKLLNSLFDPLTEIVLSKGGMLDKYIGDAIMAVFNAPVDLKDHPERACSCALEMLRVIKKLNKKFLKEFNVEVEAGIGINTGVAVIGNMGSKRRFDYTAIGSTVNLASRLEELNKVYNTNILVSENTKKKVEGKFLFRKIDRVRIKGIAREVEIYELLEDNPENRILKIRFEEALEEYTKGNFKDALKKFEEIYKVFGDKVSLVFMERCRELINKN